MTGQSMRYGRLLAPLDRFVETVESFRRGGARGANVTLPFKVDAFNYANDVTPRARAAGAVNTFKFDGARIVGDNTDGIGLYRDIVDNLRTPIEGARILLVGAGGAARGVIGPILNAHPQKLCIVNRTVSKAADLAKHFRSFGPVTATAVDGLEAYNFDIVINATSASLGNSMPALPADCFAVGALAYDMVYGKGITPYLTEAARAGARISDGLGMLVEQAAEAFFIWRGVRPATADVIEAMRTKMQLSAPE